MTGGEPCRGPPLFHLPSSSILAGTEVSIGLRVAAYCIGELAHEPHQLLYIAFIPRGEDRATEPFACLIYGVRHGFALCCDGRLADPTIGRGGLALDKAVAFQLCDLAAHRRVVAPDPLGEFDHPNWSASSRAAIRTREVEPLFDERA